MTTTTHESICAEYSKALDVCIDVARDMQDFLYAQIEQYEVRIETARTAGLETHGLTSLVNDIRNEYYAWRAREDDAIDAARWHNEEHALAR